MPLKFLIMRADIGAIIFSDCIGSQITLPISSTLPSLLRISFFIITNVMKKRKV
ncbi:MAG: hypothetical protein SYNGOMJ08_00409 [Candidatus Syntrophoarchaeum sp. GoM_oil]|nr:MAG: hypothetical protein SYNGOMJ08_00409 [Candidatus Syntrophoarchaeum sp. GoM_oil]